MGFVINLITPENDEEFVVELSNSTLTNIKGQRAERADLTFTVDRSDLESVMGGKTTFDDLFSEGKAKFDGDRKPFDQLKSMLVQFSVDFEPMPGTKAVKTASHSDKDAFEQDAPSDTAGG